MSQEVNVQNGQLAVQNIVLDEYWNEYVNEYD